MRLRKIYAIWGGLGEGFERRVGEEMAPQVGNGVTFWNLVLVELRERERNTSACGLVQRVCKVVSSLH